MVKAPAKAGEEEESVPAALAEEVSSPPDEGAPVGPSSEEEAAFLSGEDAEGGGFSPPPVATVSETELESVPLPPMEDLVNRIPAPARELIEELFRARFITVKRLPKNALKG